MFACCSCGVCNLRLSDCCCCTFALPQALLSGVPRGQLLLLDLFADEHPVWSRTACLYGHPFIWCMLHNFGGNLEMYGALPAVAEGVAAALDAAQGGMVGVGMAPEGIEQNPAVYEFMAEMAFKGRAAEAAAPGGLSAWFAKYAQRRYAAAGALPAPASAAVQGAWQLLARSVYSCSDKLHNTVCDVPTSRPGLARSEIMGWGLAPHLWYNVGDVRAAWELLLQAAAACPGLPGSSSAFVYDVLDVSRELMSKVCIEGSVVVLAWLGCSE
jgi:alpha-N-acetylglucosaminidase